MKLSAPLPSSRRSARAAIMTVALVMAGCAPDPAATVLPGARPAPRPALDDTAGESQAALRRARAERNRAANAAAVLASAEASTASRAQHEYYQAVERRLLSQKRLRRDRVPQDAPITAETLARNFLAVALRDEYSATSDGLVASTRPSPLRRWEDPVRLQLEFGPSTDLAERPAWRAEVGEYAERLSVATGHPIRLTARNGNFLVLVLTEDERRAAGSMLAQLVPGIPKQDIARLTDLPPAISCTVFAYSRGNNSRYVHAVAVIRAELPRLLRSSCIHEELAQGMGLANDSPEARPSMFNDDEEFALLTRHDELLLRILYDPRLAPGMSEQEAAPIVRQIAAELVGDRT